MPKVTFIEPSGNEKVIDAISGRSLMENAIKFRVAGIIAECGGVCACGTCRVYVELEQWRARLGQANPDESGLIEFVEEGNPFARLSCQIEVIDDMEGLVVRVAESQRNL